MMRTIYDYRSLIFCSRVKGFSLLELIVVISIISVFLIIAIPSYQHYLQRSHRQTILAEMLHLQLMQEQYYQQKGHYATMAQLADNIPDNPYYDLSITDVERQYYMIIAQAKGSQQSDNVDGQTCATLSINTQHHKQPTLCWS